MSAEKRPLKVFLSYASQDKPVVWELSRRLASEGWIDPWVDEKKLLPGQDWRTKIEEAVEDSDIVIICLSSKSVTKEGYVQKELRYAREIALEKPEETIFLVPLRLDECDVPRGLRFYQWVDYFGEKEDASYNALIESLKLRYDQKLSLEEAERARKEKIELDIAKRIAQEKISREKVEKEAAEKAQLEADELARQKAAKEKAESDAKDKIVREKTEKESAENARLETDEKARQKGVKEKVQRETTEIAVQEKALSSSPQKRHLVKKEYIIALMGTGAIIIAVLFNSPLLGKTPNETPDLSNVTQATFVSSQTLSALPTNTYPPPSEAGRLLSFSREGILTLFDMNSQQSENLLEIPDCDEKPIWYPEEQFLVICSRLFEFDMGRVNELPIYLPERTKDKISLLDKVIYSTEATDWYRNMNSSIIFIDIPTNTEDVLIDFEMTDVAHEKVSSSVFTVTYTKQVLDLISVSPSNEHLLFTRTTMVIQERTSNVMGVIPENPYAILKINPTRFFSINLSSKEIRELYCDNFYYWNAQSDIITCKNGSYAIATASRANSPYMVLDEFVIDFSSWSQNFRYMGFISAGNLYTYDIEKDTVSQLTRSNDFVDFTWLSNSNYLVAVNGDIYLFDANSGLIVYSLETPRKEISAIWIP